MPADWMIYGANGYTGRLVADAAVAKGLSPVLAGRDQAAVSQLAGRLELPHRIFDIADVSGAALEDLRLVLNCAGPFSATARPMMDACLDARVHYLDITGEIDVFRQAHGLHDKARRRDVVLVPGVGFDVVPTDCLAALLVRELPAATHLVLAFDPSGGFSPGTARTIVEGLPEGGMVRRDAELRQVPLAWKSRDIPFAHATRHAVTIPWGDVYTAYVSTGVPNIEVYMSMSPGNERRMKRLRWLQPVLGWGVVQRWLKSKVDRQVRGPDDAQRADSETQLFGEVTSADGRTIRATMRTPNGYTLTADASLAVTEHLLAESVEGGYFTPSLLMGADFAGRLPGVTIEIPADDAQS